MTCFDKTGTLTTDSLQVVGVVGADGAAADPSSASVVAAADVPEATRHVLASANALVMVNRKMAGDPLELAAIQAVGWTITNSGDRVKPVAASFTFTGTIR